MNKISTFPLFDYQGTTYNVEYCPLAIADAPFHSMVCQLKPGERSQIHNHHESEVFLFLSGVGHIENGQNSNSVSAGTGVQVRSFQNHTIVNDSEELPLIFLSIYWEPEIAKLVSERESPTKNRAVIFSTPPTPNGDLHLGHLSGPYLAADVYRRYLACCGVEAYHVTGRDDHQTYVVRKSKQLNLAPLALADDYSRQILSTLELCDIPLNGLIEPNIDGNYDKFIQEIFTSLYKAGYLFHKSAPAAFSKDGARYLHEGYIRGICPFCNKNSDGNACEECGFPNECVDLIDSIEIETNDGIQIKNCIRLYFKIGIFKKQLQEYIKTASMSAHALSFSQKFLDSNIEDICVSHPGDWGVTVPVPEFAHQKIYVWFEMAAAYLFGASKLAPSEVDSVIDKIHWAYGHDSQVIHFYGFDNTFYHTLLFPAVYLALGIQAPGFHVINELLDLENSKFSTSRGHLIWARELVQKTNVDYVRWYLSLVRPEGIRSNFILVDFVDSINGFFNRTLNQWFDSLSTVMTRFFDNRIPEAGAWSVEHRYFFEKLAKRCAQLNSDYTIHNFSPNSIARELYGLAEDSYKFFQVQAIYESSPALTSYFRTTMALSLMSLRVFASYASPIMPLVGQGILDYLSISAMVLDQAPNFIPSNITIGVNQIPYFDSIHIEDLDPLLPVKLNTKCKDYA